jgi:glutamyl-tRNA synthetase
VYGLTGQAKTNIRLESPVWQDAILIKTDGFPTYHWANVCDDHDMEITHVVRGSEWMPSTPLHVALYAAKQWVPPSFAHVPLLVDDKGQKLSKRNMDTDIASFRERHILPEALTNFSALLGWSHSHKSDEFSLQELEDVFDLKITKGNAIVSFEKLGYLQERHAWRRIRAGGEDLEQLIRDVSVAILEKEGAARVMALVGHRKLRDVVASMLEAKSLKYTTPKEFAENCSIFFAPLNRPAQPPVPASRLEMLEIAASTFLLLPKEHWKYATIASHIDGIAVPRDDSEQSQSERKATAKGHLYAFLRWALLSSPGPQIPASMGILGRDICIERLRRAIADSRQHRQIQINEETRIDTLKPSPSPSSWRPEARAAAE